MNWEKWVRICSSFADSLLSLIRVALLSRPVDLPALNSDSCVVLGNGPSLSTTLSNHINWLKTQHLVAVNHFAYSDAFMELKPRSYVLQAPEFFMEKPPSEIHNDAREKLWDRLIKQTNWPMDVFVPIQAKSSTYFNSLSSLHKHPFLTFRYYNPTPIEGFPSLTYRLYRHNLGMPRPHNVLLPAIFLMLNRGVKTLFIVGADHSWHETLQTTSIGARVDHSHFYDNKPEIHSMLKLDGKPYFVHDMFRKWHLAFKGYHDLQAYSKTIGATIFNASERTYIDAFERVNIPTSHAQS
jgi:hypothetical protein